MSVTIVTLEQTDGSRVPLDAGLQEAAEHPERFRRIRTDRYRLPPALELNPYYDPSWSPVVRDR